MKKVSRSMLGISAADGSPTSNGSSFFAAPVIRPPDQEYPHVSSSSVSSGIYSMMVPFFPANPAFAFSRVVMTARLPEPVETNSTAASIFGLSRPA